MSYRNPQRKTVTREEARAKQEKAVRFLRDVVGDSDRADQFEEMSLEEYAQHKKLQLSNPSRKGMTTMANQSRRELIEENEQLLEDNRGLVDQLQEMRDQLDDVLENYTEEDGGDEGEDGGE